MQQILLHKEFEHKEEILELLEVIDGTKEDNEVLGFLDYDNIKNGKMCRHIVCVLPYCASCDALFYKKKTVAVIASSAKPLLAVSIKVHKSFSAYRTGFTMNHIYFLSV